MSKSTTDSNEARRLKGLCSVNGQTKIMIIIGDPIKQAKTPEAINPIFHSLGANITCIPGNIPATDLTKTWQSLKATKNLVGIGVTIPHKAAVLELCDSLDPAARQVGAVNVVRRESNGQFRGYQFDGKGFVRGLDRQGHSIVGRECLLLGAGGAASAIALALADAGASKIRIANRTHQKAIELSGYVNKTLGSNLCRAAKPKSISGQLIVNATSLGMNPEDALPMDPSLIDNTMTVAEVVASPEITAFLIEAQKLGASVHSGMHMIQNQVDLIARHFLEVSQT